MVYKALALSRQTTIAAHGAAVMCLLALILYLFTLPAMAQGKVLGALTLTDDINSVSLGPYTIVQKDTEGKISAQNILAARATNLSGKISTQDLLYLGFDGSPVWLSVKLTNDSRQTDWILDLGRRSEGRLGPLKSVNVYQMDFNADQTVSMTQIAAASNKGVYKLTIPQGAQKLILLNVTPAAGTPSIVPLSLYNENGYIQNVQNRATFNTAYLFMTATIALCFIALAAMRRNYKPLIFGAYFILVFLAWMLHEAVGAKIGPSATGTLLPVMILCYSLLSIFMTKIFYGIEQGSFAEKYVLYGLAWLTIIASVMSYLLPVSNGLTQIALLYGAPFITTFILSLMSLAQAKNDPDDPYLYFFGLMFPLIGLGLVIACCFQVVPLNVYTITTVWYFFVPQGAMLYMALRYKLKIQANDAKPKQQTATQDGTLNLSRLKETRESADNLRLMKVLEKERELLSELRDKDTSRVEEMKLAKEEADEANRAKSAFLAVVSHEIRTPMTGVMGMVRLLLDSSITKQQRDYVLTIQESSEAMLSLLNDILDFEKIQRGKIELENISFDLQRLIQGVVHLMSGHAAQKQIALAARVDEHLPRFVKGDPTRLRQVLLNLMGNAIKFTEGGSVTLIVRNLDQGGGDDMHEPDKYNLYFAVQDTGIGISHEAQKNLFNPFSQASSSIARKFGGSGLGLAISKGLIENMGSNININSKEGEGSTFFFTLEMARGARPMTDNTRKEPVAEVTNIRPLKILVVDDNAITRKVVIGFIDNGQHAISVAGSAEEALQKIDETNFDLIFMDIELPGMTGNEATKILRRHTNQQKAAIPVIALTGNTAREEIDRYLADGMNAYLSKPIDPDHIKSMVVEIASKAPSGEIKIPALAHLREESAPPKEETKSEVFNPEMLQSLKKTIGADQLSALLGDLVDKTDEIVNLMIDAAERKDLTALSARAHELKGMTGNFGLTEISMIASIVERKVKSDEIDEVLTLARSLPDANVRARHALKQWASSE